MTVRPRAGVVKDAGDDPDVTHNALVKATVARRAHRARACAFRAGDGVGTVTNPGLPLPPGEPAIDPVPRGDDAPGRWPKPSNAAADRGDVIVEISIPGGQMLAGQGP